MHNASTPGSSTGPFEWDEKYSVNVDEIDEQHKKLVDLIKQLHDSLEDGSASETVGEVLNEMAEYTEYHFETLTVGRYS